MKTAARLACLGAATLTLHAEETRTLTLDLGKAPVFATFTDAGVRFRNPDPMMRPLPRGYQQSISLESGPIHLKLIRDGKPVADLGETKLSVSFSGADLKPPGDSYPPAPPVQADTPVASIHFGIQDETLPQVDARVLPLAKDLGTAAEKLSAWLKHELWKHTQAFQAEQNSTPPYAELTLAPAASRPPQDGARDEDAAAADPRFNVFFRILWKQPEPSGFIPRAVPPPQPPRSVPPPQPGAYPAPAQQPQGGVPSPQPGANPAPGQPGTRGGR